MSAARASLAALLGLTLWTAPPAGAQPRTQVARVGVISETATTDPFLEAFRQGLRELGYVEGQNVVVEYRHAQGAIDRVRGFSAELVGLKVDVLVVGGAESTRAATAVTKTVPIVFVTSGDPIAGGLVTSLARPGGNVTGLSILSPELAGKQLELLKTVTPRLSRVALLFNPMNPAAKQLLDSAREAARTLDVELHAIEVRTRGDIAGALKAVPGRRPGALLVLPDPVLGSELSRIAKVALDNRLPAIYIRREFTDAGGLLAYGPSFADNYRRGAAYVDKILKGARPGDLPVEQPAKFELVINLKTAKAFGLTIPQPLLFRADQVID